MPETRRFSYGRNKFFSSFSCKRTARPPYSRSVGATFFRRQRNLSFETPLLCAYNIHILTYTCINTVLRVPTYLLLFRFFFLFPFVCHAAEAQSRQTQGRHSSWRRMWKYDGNISLFVALARPDDSVAVPRHEAFISKYVHWYVQAPGSSLNKCRSIYKGSKMRVFSLFRSASFPSSSFSISYSSVSSLSFHLFVSFTSASVFFLFFSIRADDGCK